MIYQQSRCDESVKSVRIDAIKVASTIATPLWRRHQLSGKGKRRSTCPQRCMLSRRCQLAGARCAVASAAGPRISAALQRLLPRLQVRFPGRAIMLCCRAPAPLTGYEWMHGFAVATLLHAEPAAGWRRAASPGSCRPAGEVTRWTKPAGGWVSRWLSFLLILARYCGEDPARDDSDFKLTVRISRTTERGVPPLVQRSTAQYAVVQPHTMTCGRFMPTLLPLVLLLCMMSC